jgi:hypothetical protein
MRDLVRAEWRKIFSGRAWWALVLVGVALSVLGDAGFMVQSLKQRDAGQLAAGQPTQGLVQGWFAVELFAALVTLVAVTREYDSGAICRSVLLSGGRGRLVAAKFLASAGSGLLIALPTAALAAAAPFWFESGHDLHPVWRAEETWTLLGVAASVVAGAVWGCALGLLIRHRVGAVVVLLANTWVVSEAVFRLAPSVGRFTFDEALAAVYHGGAAHLLPVPAAWLVLAAWLLLACAAARRLFDLRDLT